MSRRATWPAALLLLALAAGCGGTYEAEKLYWKADRLKKAVQRTPEGTPQGLFQKARDAFEKVRTRFPGTAQADFAQISIAELHALEGNAAAAEAAFGEAIRSHPDDEEIRFQAERGLAALWEKQGDWDKALAQYRRIMREYETRPAVLSIPIYVARRYVLAKDKAAADAAYGEAAAYYARLEQKYPRSPLALACLWETYQCHADRGLWPEALETLGRIRKDYPGTREAERALAARLRILRGLKAAEPRPS